MICKDFLHYFSAFNCCNASLRLVYFASMTETHEVQTSFMKIGSGNVCLFSCHFYYINETCRYFVFSKKRVNGYKYMDPGISNGPWLEVLITFLGSFL